MTLPDHSGLWSTLSTTFAATTWTHTHTHSNTNKCTMRDTWRTRWSHLKRIKDTNRCASTRIFPLHVCVCVYMCVCRPSAHKYKSAVVHDSLSKTMHCKTIPCYATITHSLPLSLSLSHSLFHSHYHALSLSLYVVVCVKFIVGPASSENFSFP